MIERLIKTIINLLLESEDVDTNQKELIKRYKENRYFMHILSYRGYNEIPSTLDYILLVEDRILNLKNQRIKRLFKNINTSKLSGEELSDIDRLLEISKCSLDYFNNYQEKAQRLSFLDKEYKKHVISQFMKDWKENFLPDSMYKVFKHISEKPTIANRETEKILNCFDEQNNWTNRLIPSGQKPLTTKKDIKNIKRLCDSLARTSNDSDLIFTCFFKNLLKAKKTLRSVKINDSISLEDYLDRLPDDWFSEPWYYAYVQYFGTDETGKGSFKTLKKQLDYLEKLEIKNLYLLPHYESPQGDAGYDISAYFPSKKLGGEEEFIDFINEATLRGFRIATDLVFNHTSTDHKWFKAAIAGKARFFDYYLKCPSNWQHLDLKEILTDENGDLFLNLKEKNKFAEKVNSKRILIFPDVDKTLWLEKYIKPLNKKVLFYREFYPFQVDLDLQNPEVLNELFKFLARELSQGILGKRTDAIAHWIKEPGTQAKNLSQTYALHELIKEFIVHVSSKCIILPEVVTSTAELKKYAGIPTTINGKKTTSAGDALLDFQLQGMLREMLYFQKTSPFWQKINIEFNRDINNTSKHLLPIEHHDEIYMGFIDEIEAMRGYISERGIIYKNGMSGGARYSECLNRNATRIANAFFCLYMMPATPVIYYGTEVGAINNFEQMKQRQQKQYETFNKLLGSGHSITFESCKDPRELQRGNLKATKFEGFLNSDYPAINIIKTLNRLRKERSALRSYFIKNIDNGNMDPGILGMLRFPEKNISNEPVLLAISNITDQPKEIKINIFHLGFLIKGPYEKTEKLRQIFYFQRINNNKALISENFKLIYDEKDIYQIKIEPYSSFLFECL
ncbi:MAG: alpha-amylase family glycosyl hydrolase [Cyanobacteriota bacterium]